MQVAGAYLLVVLVWSTTPLGIHFSNSSLSFVAAITVRMLLAFILCYGLLRLTGETLVKERRDWLLFAASGFGLFPNMLLIYWAAQYVPSGLMSVIMGIYPFFVGLFSWLLLRENPFTPVKILGLVLAVFGLWIIHHQQVAVGPDSVKGLLVMVVACVIWGISTIWVKKLGAHVSPLRQGTGSLAFALPFFVMAWFFLDGKIPEAVDQKSILAVLYLVTMGSLLGHTLWFFVLQKCNAVSVSLVTLITPVLAITWGIVFADESFSAATLIGAFTILVGLTFYQGILPMLYNRCHRLFGKRQAVAVTSVQPEEFAG